MAWLTMWIKTLIMVVLFAAFLELLLPTSSMQRFVRLIMGLIIMLAILNPVIELFHGDGFRQPLEAVAAWKPEALEVSASDNSAIVHERDRLAQELYCKELSQQIAAVVLPLEGVADAKVVVKLAQTKEGKVGALERVNIYIKPGTGSKFGAVDKVVIAGADKKVSVPISPALKQKVISTVAGLYQLKNEQIEIMELDETK
ncbi:MAG: stage sporulation protein [Firmicutes bacterium]|nr:stage sporulation protein [Bacillota bacterium]